MKISKKDFQNMQKKYGKEIKKGKSGKNKKGKVTNQTDWIFFDRETLQNLLDQTNADDKVGGIKFYFAEYTQKLAKKWHQKDPDSYCGGLTLVLKAANLVDGKTVDVTSGDPDDQEYDNDGRKCPPTCDF